MANVKLNLVALENANQTFGQTDYVVFQAETTDKHPVVVAITQNALIGANINLSLVDYLNGSSITIKDDTDIRTGEFISGEDRVNRVVNQDINPVTGRPYQIVLANRANCSITKSELYLAETKDFASAVQSKVVIEQAKERKLNAMRRASDRLRNAIGVKAESTPSAEPVLETNTEESPF